MASCAICDKPALFRCARCKVERYCSRECQRDHWPHHKTRCVQLAAAAKAAAVDRPAAGDPAESATQHRQPQPPPSPPPPRPLPPQPPSQFASPNQSGSFRNNPRTARLLGELLPSLQPEAAEAATQPAAIPAGPITAPNQSFLSSGSGNAANAASAGGRGGVEDAPAHGSGVGASVPQPLPSPPVSLRPQPQARSPLGPSTPLPMQPAPPPGSPHAPSGRASSMRVVRSHLREVGVTAAGGLQVDGSGILGSGSILDHATPPVPPVPPVPPTPGRTADGGGAAVGSLPAELSAAGSYQHHHHQDYHNQQLGSSVAAELTPAQQQQQQQQWPWAPSAATSAADTLAGADSASAGAGAAARISCLSDLPPEVLLEVLKALPARSLAAAAAVCRSWRRAAREPWLWVRQLCAAGYALPAAAYVARQQQVTSPKAATAAAAVDGGDVAAGVGVGSGGPGARAVAGVRGIRAVRAVHAAGGSSHEDFLGGLRAGFLDRLQQNHHHHHHQQSQPQQQQRQHPKDHGHAGQQQRPDAPPPDLKDLYGRTVRMESNWRSARYAEMALREHSSNVECLAFQHVEPWGSVLLSAAWDGSVRVFSLGSANGAPQQARCVRRYRGHTGWITCMAAGQHHVVTASTDRRVAAWRYYSESSDPWVVLEHPQEVTLVRFCYAPPPLPTTRYLAHHICQDDCGETAAAATTGAAGGGGGSGSGGSGGMGLYGDGVGGTPNAAAGAAAHAATGATATAAAAVAGDGMHGGSGCGTTQDCSADVLALKLPYDPQWEDWVVTGCIDGAIRLWHLPTKQPLRTFSGHGDVVWGIAVLYGSSVMVSSSRDCTTKLWQLPPYSAMQAAVQAPSPPGAAASGVGGAAVRGRGDGSREHAAGGDRGGGGSGGSQTLESLATFCGHTSAILCMDVHQAPPGVVTAPAAAPGAPPVTAAAAAAGGDAYRIIGDAAAGVGGRARRDGGIGVYDDIVTVLSHLLNTGLMDAPSGLQAASCGGGGRTGEEDPAALAAAPRTAAASAALPVWLVATGGADAVVRVWNLATAQCHTTLRGHSVGVLSVQFGYLPRRDESHRDQMLLPPDLDVASGPRPLSLALPPGQYGSCRARPQRLPPSQRLVLVTGSVREVRVWDPVAGTALAQLSDHSGPVTSLALVHGMLATLAMNDGLIVYTCKGLDGSMEISGGSDADSGGRGGGSSAATAASLARPGSAVGRLRRVVSAHRRLLEPVICMQLEGLAVGSGTGDITYLDFRPRASPLPLLHPRRRQV
ncbi:hypothetical protein VOLCADRAFT_86388 [Volvox carteri f. nagariensis]|uniref:Uncharacterized protein n=1 Tax=Volvox carteri f. nagariensis TaxID=3068 RepID=D8TIM9_VOLCA|nr:uncharacterized protein VOLCADRAFT_86388 [Volvox carteri f. nagariensis]EFJ52915.1 hypothetical protein VOLCADRAFT_86388 [Volvox carteri f. nagariensis]|eukprot:XP_002945920.1 hypothetical protein VOLCADRAFT_86388 [Volvox carteri f. nagariensis]